MNTLSKKTIFNSTTKNCFILGGLIGAVVFFLVFGFSILNPLNDSFFLTGYIEKDIVQHYSGWLFFKNSGWQFPLGVTTSIDAPYGSSISFSDSIPLVSILFKLFAPLMPASFQFFGIYSLLCYVLQGGFAAIIVKLFSNNKILIFSSSLLFCTAPILVERTFRHVALTSHFLILACIYFYFKSYKQITKSNFKILDYTKEYLPFVVINILAIGIHPYFLPFTFGIMFAKILQDVFTKKLYWQAPVMLLFSLLTTSLFGFVIGLFIDMGGTNVSEGYGAFSANLNTFLNPYSIGFSNWSNILPVLHQHKYQYDGFNYLGFGILIGVVIALISLVLTKNLKQSFLEFIKNHYGIIFSCFALSVFAITHICTISDKIIFNIPVPPSIVSVLSTFRASGRFLNLLVYLIMLFVIYGISKLSKKHITSIIISAIALLQIFDISNVLMQKHNYFYGKTPTDTNQAVSSLIPDDFWQIAAKNTDKIISLTTDTHTLPIAFDISLLAAKTNNTINIAGSARVNTKQRHNLIQQQKSQFEKGIVEDNTLYLIDYPQNYLQLLRDNKAKILKIDNTLVMISTTLYKKISNEYDFSNATFVSQTQFTLAYYSDIDYTNGVNYIEKDIKIPAVYESFVGINNFKTITAENGSKAKIGLYYIKEDKPEFLYSFIQIENGELLDFEYPALLEFTDEKQDEGNA